MPLPFFFYRTAEKNLPYLFSNNLENTMLVSQVIYLLSYAFRLFQLDLGPPKKLNELEPDSREYWKLLRKEHIWRHNKLHKGKKMQRVWTESCVFERKIWVNLCFPSIHRGHYLRHSLRYVSLLSGDMEKFIFPSVTNKSLLTKISELLQFCWLFWIYCVCGSSGVFLLSFLA